MRRGGTRDSVPQQQKEQSMTTVSTPADRKRSALARFADPNVLLMIAGVLFIVVVSSTVPRFMSFRNITNIVVQSSSIGLMAIGLTFVIVTGGIDLSSPPVMALSAILGCKVMVTTQNVVLGVATALVAGACLGALNGLSVAVLRMVPMIVTLAVATICSGVANWYTGAKSISGMPVAYKAVVDARVMGVPMQALIFCAVALLMHLVLTKTIFGRHVFMVGVNEKAATVCGVNTRRVIFLAYLLAGLLSGIAGVVAAARLNSAGPSLGPQNMFMNVVCAVVLGGASVAGGKGSILGTFSASIFMAIIANVMNLLNVQYFVTYVINGCIIVLVTYFDVIRSRLARKG